MGTMCGYGVIEPTISHGWIEKEIPEVEPFEVLCSPVAILPCTSDVHNAKYRRSVTGGGSACGRHGNDWFHRS